MYKHIYTYVSEHMCIHIYIYIHIFLSFYCNDITCDLAILSALQSRAPACDPQKSWDQCSWPTMLLGFGRLVYIANPHVYLFARACVCVYVLTKMKHVHVHVACLRNGFSAQKQIWQFCKLTVWA